MHHYSAIVHREGASASGLSLPHLPACLAAVDDWAGIPAGVREALDLWLEDRAEQQARTLGEMRHLPGIGARGVGCVLARTDDGNGREVVRASTHPTASPPAMAG